MPEGTVRLLGPQHWAKTFRKRTAKKAFSRTSEAEAILDWNNGESRRMVELDPQTNVATFRLAPGYSKFSAFCAEAEIQENDDDNPIAASSAALIEDDFDEEIPDQTTNMAEPEGDRLKLIAEFDDKREATAGKRPIVIEDEEE